MKTPTRRNRNLARRVAVTLAILAGGATIPESANAATVPNQFVCSHASKRCYQTNGSYKPQYPCAIRMKHVAIGYTGFTENYIHRTCSHTYYLW
jgi:hypothetical protein